MKQLETQIVEIFCEMDEFCKVYENYCQKNLLVDKSQITPKSGISLSEIMTILVCFHLSNHRTFKWFYLGLVQLCWKKHFPKLPSYNRFVELMRVAIVPLTLYMVSKCSGNCTGISFVDSTTLDVCHTRRINFHKVFKNLAKKAKSSTGWFYGFKLHLVINDRGEIISFCLTAGNVDDRNTDVMDHLSKNLFGKLFGDRGYLSKTLFEDLYQKNITLVTKLKKNMKNRLMDLCDKILLRKRAIIESVNDFLKNICQIEHTRHRSPTNFLANLVSGVVAYCFIPKKPSLNIDRNIYGLLAA